MKTLILSSQNIESLLDLDELREVMKTALKTVSSGTATNEPRQVIEIPQQRALGFMPAYSLNQNIIGYKVVSVFPKNHRYSLNPHQGLVSLICGETGRVLALLDGSTITAVRTAAVSAVATEVLSRKDSRILSIVGSGVQALHHIQALSKVREFEKIYIYSRNPLNSYRLKSVVDSVLDIQCVVNSEPCFHGADVIVTCTSSSAPIVNSQKFSPGAHVNAIGSCRPGQQEIDLRSDDFLKIYLDHKVSCEREADEVFRPLTESSLLQHLVGEIGEVLNADKPGRTKTGDITFFKSVGLAIEDVFAAQLFFAKAVQSKIGTFVQF